MHFFVRSVQHLMASLVVGACLSSDVWRADRLAAAFVQFWQQQWHGLVELIPGIHGEQSPLRAAADIESHGRAAEFHLARQMG